MLQKDYKIARKKFTKASENKDICYLKTNESLMDLELHEGE